ncbi:FAD-dependent oxidoreductase [bacterium]|nr:FAD-dependent oxidoreductase [bacterium]
MKLAIVGSGIAGLVAAHHLHREHDITVFEANDYVGGHTHTVEVEEEGRRLAIDTGFIVFNQSHYPRFTALLDELRVETQPTVMSFGVSAPGENLEYNGTSLNTLFAQRRNLASPGFWRMLADIARFHEKARQILAEGDEDLSVRDYLRTAGLSRRFGEHYLLPLGSSLWSCPPEQFGEFPIRFVAEFLHNHAMLQWSGRPQWRVVAGGSQRYVEKLTAPWSDRIRLCTPVHRVMRAADGVRLMTSHGVWEDFEHVVLACHADQALRMLADASPLEREVLGAFPYQRNTAVLHTDTSVLPRRRRAWAAWNYRVPARPNGRVFVTYNMNHLQSLDSATIYCVTLNGEDEIDPGHVIARFDYSHPLYVRGRRQAQGRHGDLVNANRTSFCGAYWGFGFHEDGVRSAEAVALALKGVGHEQLHLRGSTAASAL